MSDRLYEDLSAKISALEGHLREIKDQCKVVEDAKIRAYQNGIAGLYIDEYDLDEILNDIDRAADTIIGLKQMVREVI